MGNLAIDSEIRCLAQATARAPQFANRLMGDALTPFLFVVTPFRRQLVLLLMIKSNRRISRLSTLLGVVFLGDEVDLSLRLREGTVMEYIVLVHHCLLCLVPHH